LKRIATSETTLALAKKHKSHNVISRCNRTLRSTQANMKRYSNLYEKVYNIDNIFKAYNNAKKGKKHYHEVKMIEKDEDRYLFALQDILINKQFVNSEYEVFIKQTGGKQREIYRLPFYPDRIVHHCIVQVMYPIWIKLLIRDTFSTIPGRGVHDGVYKLKAALKDVQGTQYCLKLDVRKFYPSVDHGVLKNILARKIKDQRLISLLDEIIDSAPGIPIGNYISQWFGNLYLAYFDHYVKEQLGIKYYFRYCDDLVILSDSKQHLRGVQIAIKQYLNEHLKLNLKSNNQIFPVGKRGIDFLGYRFYHTHILIRKSILKEFKRKIKGNLATPETQSAYWGWFKHANTYNLTQKYFKNEGKPNKAS